MRVAIVRYPGSNCDIDTKLYFSSDEDEAFYIWHSESTTKEKFDLLVIPGGFAFGDRVYENATHSYRISPGEMALKSPVQKIIRKAYENKIPILGICNGFQILTRMYLLPGSLELNDSEKFESRLEKCIFQESGDEYSIPIANSFGRYVPKKFDDYRVFLNYENGDIAGISNMKRTVFGMMPHPERVRRGDLGRALKEELKNLIFKKKIIDHQEIERIMASEHVSYKSTKKYLSKLYTEGDHVIQGPGENAGIIDIGDGYALFMRIESHNHPIYIEPFQGAATGVGGILRDVFTMGARPIALFDFLRFGENMPHFLENETISGISYYGNCVGVPVVGGDYKKNRVFDKNPLLNVGCIGIGKKENIIYGNALEKGSLFVYIGAKTSLDGVGGADMASQEFREGHEIDKDTIQKGDPFLEKLLLELCCELSESNLVEGMQDLGAGGLLCASLEMVERGRKKTDINLGCTIYVSNVPVKTNHMTNTEIMISESQERMLLTCRQENLNDIIEKCKYWDLEFSVIGRVTDNGLYTIQEKADVVYQKEINSFSSFEEDWPLQKRENLKEPRSSVRVDRKNWEVYDNTLGGRTIKGPLEDGSYAVLDLYEIGKKLYVTWGSSVEECYQKLNKMDVEGKAVVNCLNFGHPKDIMGELVECVEKMNEECQKYKIPVIGGNVSLYNSTDGVSIPPTPIIMMIGIA